MSTGSLCIQLDSASMYNSRGEQVGGGGGGSRWGGYGLKQGAPLLCRFSKNPAMGTNVCDASMCVPAQLIRCISSLW